MWVMSAQTIEDLDDSLDRALTLLNGTPVYQLNDVERAAIHAVYQLYEEMLGQPHIDMKPPELGAARPHLYSAYNQVQIGGRLVTLRERLIASAISCPYCGFGEPTDLDHYLPRSEYGDLAIYPNNLIPSCGKCNNAKRTVVPGVYGPGLIHPYFQELPDVDFLKAHILFEADSLDVIFQIDAADILPPLAAKLQFQIERLKLNDRYPKQINKFISEQRTAILMIGEFGAEYLSEYLRKCSASLARSFHRNDWRVALMRALAEDASFCATPETYLGPEA